MPPTPHPLLPPGPADGRLTQTVALHRDPLGTLQRHRARFGDVFTLRTATAGPVVVVADPVVGREIPNWDPESAHAGAARRRVLPMASPRSVFGADGETHATARRRVSALFEPAAVARRRDAMTAIAARHVATWPRRRPFRLLPRMRALADEIFVDEILGVRGQRGRALAAAIGGLLWTPGNPPLTVPGPKDGLVGRLVDLEYRRRRRRIATAVEAEIAERRAAGEPGEGVLGALLADERRQTSDALVEELLALLMAAQEPMAAALTWSALRIAEAPAMRERFLACGARSDYGAAVISETLRLQPPALASLRRLARARSVCGHRLPAGTTVLAPIPLLHRDPRIFADPRRLRPERHLEDPALREAMLPFGGGARRCLAEWLAREELDAALPVVLGARGLRPAGPQPERMVLRATILVPQRSGLVVAR